MADNDDHYAIVIGLTGYPLLGEPPPSNLRGPINDAEAVRAWLADPKGGGLPDKNITFIPSPDPVPAAGAPARDEIHKAFEDLAKKAEDARTGVGALLGRRLYVFVAGHGFSPMLKQGCLLAGNAGGYAVGANVWVTRWLEQFQDAGYFFETVLWMDCCMNRDTRDTPSLPTMRAMVSDVPPGPSFAALAARRPLRAVEHKGPDKKYHGVFTTVLLEGLRGAAANPYGMVTGRSLADWLRNAQRSRLTEDELADPRVSKEPDILKEDQELVFARGIPPALYDVELEIAGSGGKQARLWSRRPLVPEAMEIPASGKLQVRRSAGLYAIEVEELGIRQGFEISKPGSITISEKGPPVDIDRGLVPIRIDPSDPVAEIYLVDEAFSLVDRDVGVLSTTVPPAIYKTRIRSGDRLAEQVYLLDRKPSAAEAVPDLPAFASAAPIPGTAFTHEYQVNSIQEAAAGPAVKIGTGAELLLMSRAWRRDTSNAIGLPDTAGLELWNGSRKLADLGDGRVGSDPDPWATLLVEADPGTYFVRRTDEQGAIVEQALVAVKDWRTSFFFLVTPNLSEPVETGPPRSALLMHPKGGKFDFNADRLILHAQNAVGKARAALTDELQALLIDQPPSPLAAILGGHMLLLEQQKRPSLKIALLGPLVERLRQSFDDFQSADLEALALALGDGGEIPASIGLPPMLKASWDIITQASLKYPALVAPDLFAKVFASVPSAPFMTWATDRRSRSAQRTALRATFKNERKAAKAKSAFMQTMVTKNLQVPGLTDLILGSSGRPRIGGPGGISGLGAGGLAGFGPGADAGLEMDVGAGLQQGADFGPPADVKTSAAAAPSLTDEAAAKLRALGLPASALDL